MDLTYRPHARIQELAVGECTIHRAGDATGARWWLLWFFVARETDGVPEDFCVPVYPDGAASSSGPGGRTWALTQASPGTWQVSPSVNILDTGEAVAVRVGMGSLWHQTPTIVGVPTGEPWAGN